MIENLPHIDLSIFQSKEAKELVILSLNIIENQQQQLNEQKILIQSLKDEINRLKGEQGKPDIKANTKPKNNNTSTDGKEKRKKPHNKQAKKQNIPVDKTEYIDYDKSKLPDDAEFKFYDEVITQDIIIKRENILYKIAVYYSPSEKKTYRFKIPEGKSYHSDDLKAFIIVQNKVLDVTNKKLLTMLQSMGIEISAGSLSNILLEYQDLAQADKDAILKAGLSNSYTQTDITGARVSGKNHNVHIITNDLFTSYTTLPGKSALDVLAAYQVLTTKDDLLLIYNKQTIQFLEEAKISKKDKKALDELLAYDQKFKLPEFEKHIEKNIPRLYNKRNIFIKVKNAFALSYYRTQKDVQQSDCVVSDNAPEYNKIAKEDHALCWVHDSRPYKKLTPVLDIHRDAVDDFMDKYWSFYHELLDYKDNPNQELALKLSDKFDVLFSTKTNYFQLDKCIKNSFEKKQELLTVLKRPEIPLHNNLAELGARRQVRKRDISLHTMTTAGTKNQDAFMSITQTAIQLGVDVFKYIKELISDQKNRTSLADIIYQKINFNTS
jgi:hypothetical protein